MDRLIQDLKFALRLIGKSPAISFSVIVALALGIGANTAMFSVIDAALLRPLRYERPDQLLLVWEKDSQGQTYGASPANLLDWRSRSKTLTGFAGWQNRGFVYTGGDRPERLNGASVTANLFETIGAKPLLGRTFIPGEDGVEQQTPPSKVAVLSHQLWSENFGGDPAILSKTLRLNGQPYSIVGVMPPDFYYLSKVTQVWVPGQLNRNQRDFRSWTTVARLVPGQDARSALTEMQQIAAALAREYPKNNQSWTVQTDALLDWIVGEDFRDTLLMLFAAIGLVLLLACVNIANLLLARSAGRQREAAIRVALGATRGRLLAQLTTESVVLSALGGLLGLCLTWTLLDTIVKLVPASLMPPVSNVRINEAVLVFTAAVALVTGFLFGIAPAWMGSNPALAGHLKDGGRGVSGGRRRQSFQQILVLGEVSVAVMLLAGAGLLLESLWRLTAVDLGIRPEGVLTMRVSLPPSKYPDADGVRRFTRQMTDSIRSNPGVQSVAIMSDLPLRRISITIPFETESMTPRPQADRPGILYVTVNDGFLETLGARLLGGRNFTPRDTAGSPPVVMVNEEFAKRFSPANGAVGQRVRINLPGMSGSSFGGDVMAEVVGVIGNIRHGEAAAPPEPVMYAPIEQNLWSPNLYVAVRSSQDPASLITGARMAIQSLDREQPVDRTLTLTQMVRDNFSVPRFRTQLLGAFAILALILAVVGIYGVNAYAVSQRQHEIGVRLALGATPAEIVRQTVGQGMRTTFLGLILGTAGALSLTTVLKNVLFGVESLTVRVYAIVSLVLFLVALLACYLPARRASRVDPMRSLRQD
ncbi:MAG: ABC transporter permease [Bryobacteraceae bacterium]|nr:ABC transporter permease [Bryobacteraceae bacterium]